MTERATYDAHVVRGFGDEWTRFDQSARTEGDLRQTFEAYFAVFPWDALPPKPVGFDLGCGSGRWAKFVAPRVARLVCVDASEDALAVAKRHLAGQPAVQLQQASAGDLPFADGSFDFGYSLGVLHHVPDPAAGLADAVRCLRPGAPMLLYLYYAMDNRPLWFRTVWRSTDVIRRSVSRLPHGARYAASQVLAALVYWPLARLAKALEARGLPYANLPLAEYRRKPFYVMRTDALDRFGTRIEYRFSRREMQVLMERAGLERITFSERAPYWCAVGFRPR
jgi:SAM-dependent methyltransferase